MLYPTGAERVYYHILEGSSFIFSDERCKKKLLDMIFELHRRLGWRLYAFCVTDSSAHFLSVTSWYSFEEGDLQRVAEDFVYWCTWIKGIWCGDCIDIRARCIKELKIMDEIVGCCCQIHCLPLKMGYVERIDDYWWSSYITYTGSFLWDTVDFYKVLCYFSMNFDIARSRMRKFHSSIESPTLYITDAKNKNDGKIILLNENISFS